ncbi:hypothetical protein [Natribacillus halophilus]|uniref:Uncharacterized protein n=1 Tax=Natribacillus halophilus TaxID=549003 RepID=A0A1G8NID8_9BACI|nr:hypothetical protein [Natribacillus halophilus]SDI79994.1 hypothetical protein SAMN04488123_106100 [Natribacillus halophilus]
MRLLPSIVLLVVIFLFAIFYTDLLNFTGIDPEIDFRMLEYFALQSILFTLAGALLSLLFVDLRRFRFRAFSIVAWVGAGIILVCFWMPYFNFLPNVIIFHPEAHTFLMITVGILIMAGFFKNRSE